MINPFTPMPHNFIPVFRARGKRYLVLQNFTLEDNLFKKDKKYVLISHYDDKGIALQHHSRVQHQEIAQFIDLEDEKEREELESINSEYVLYSVMITDPELVKKVIDNLKYKIMKYIAAKPKWRISRHHSLKPQLTSIFGELQVVMNYGSDTIEVPLKEIEKY